MSPFWLAFKIGMHVYFNSLSATYLFPIHPIKLQSSNKFTSTFFHPLKPTRTIPWVNPILKNISALSREILRIRVSTKMWKPYFTTFHYFYYLSSMKFYYLLTAFLYLRNLKWGPCGLHVSPYSRFNLHNKRMGHKDKNKICNTHTLH